MTNFNEALKHLPEKPLLRVDEVALFFDVTKQTIYTWYATETLKGCNINGTLRIYRESVIVLLEKNTNRVTGIEYEEEIMPEPVKKNIRQLSADVFGQADNISFPPL